MRLTRILLAGVSASGSLHAQNSIQWGPDANVSLTTSNSSATIEQALEWQDGGGPITVTVALDWQSEGSVDNGGQANPAADLRFFLTVPEPGAGGAAFAVGGALAALSRRR